MRGCSKKLSKKVCKKVICTKWPTNSKTLAAMKDAENWQREKRQPGLRLFESDEIDGWKIDRL
jgi:hypothetical protein